MNSLISTYPENYLLNLSLYNFRSVESNAKMWIKFIAKERDYVKDTNNFWLK